MIITCLAWRDRQETMCWRSWRPTPPQPIKSNGIFFIFLLYFEFSDLLSRLFGFDTLIDGVFGRMFVCTFWFLMFCMWHIRPMFRVKNSHMTTACFDDKFYNLWGTSMISCMRNFITPFYVMHFNFVWSLRKEKI